MGTRLLIVDDDEVLGRVLRRVLRGYGYDAFHAAGFEEALWLAREHQPRLVLVDLCLPDGDGVELARQLKVELEGAAFILMTAYPLRLNEHPELADDFARVLAKPLDLTVLRETLRAAWPCPVHEGCSHE
jgi:CheY-like chemotaxis protein